MRKPESEADFSRRRFLRMLELMRDEWTVLCRLGQRQARVNTVLSGRDS
jgi:hypothetical protein